VRRRCRGVLPTILGLLLLAIIGIYVWENHIIDVAEVEVPIKGLAADIDGMRIALFSDLHGRPLNVGWVENLLLRHDVDLIALTGDYVRGRDVGSLARLGPLLKLLPQIAPTYAICGNHDRAAGWDEIKALLEQHGISVLDNSYTYITRGAAQLILAGLSYPYDSIADLQRTLPLSADTIVLLTHSPQVFRPEHLIMMETERTLWQELMQRPSLTLVGHTHGGQIKLPLLGAVTTASGQLFPQEHVEGLSWEGSGWLYISRGLGYTGMQMRFLSRPEIAIITLRGAD